MKKTVSILITFFCIVAVAQPPARFYTKFGGNGVDVGYSAKQTLDKQYIIAGSTSSYGAGNSDVYLVKLDSMGQILWEKTFGGFANDVGKAVIQVADSGYVIAGFTNSYGAGGYDAYILRTDKNGVLIWQKTYGGTDWDFASDLVRTPDGDLAVVGNTSSFGSGKKDGFILKYDFLGNLIWQKLMGGVEDDELKSIITTTDGFLATVGYTQSKSDVNGDCYFAKYNLNGDTLFTRTFGGIYKDYANDLTQKINGDYFIAGAKTYSVNLDPEAYMYSFSSTGIFSWDHNYVSTIKNEGFVSVANSKHIPMYTAFLRTMSFFGGDQQAENFVAKPQGWGYLINAFGGGGKETCYSIESTTDGGFVTVGTTESYGAVNGDVFFIKQDSTIINYTSVVGINQNTKNIRPYILYQKNLITINFDGYTGEFIEIYDIIGKLQYRGLITNLNTEIDINQLTSSVYILRIKYKNGQEYNTKFIHQE